MYTDVIHILQQAQSAPSYMTSQDKSLAVQLLASHLQFLGNYCQHKAIDKYVCNQYSNSMQQVRVK